MIEEVELQVSQDPIIDASVSTLTDPILVDRMLNYSIIFKKDSTDGNPIIEIQGANELSDFVNPYKFNDGVIPFTMELDEDINSAIDRGIWAFKYFRIKTEPNGTTTGTLNYQLTFQKG